MSQSWASMHNRPRLLKLSGTWPAEQASRFECMALRNASVFNVSTVSVMPVFSVFQVMPVIPVMLVFTVFPVIPVSPLQSFQ